jgi:hypothetical protein
VCDIIVFVRSFFAFTFALDRRRRRDARRGRFPNQASPFVSFTQQLKRRERMAGMTLNPKHFRDHLQLLPRLTKDFEPDATANLR